MTKAMFQFPFHLECDLSEFYIASDLKVIKMESEMREKLFGINNLQRNEKGYSYISTSRDSLDIPNAGFLTSFLLSEKTSNYVLLTENIEKANIFNFALKLIEDSSTTLYTGYDEIFSSARSFTSLCNYDQSLSPLKVSHQEVLFLTKLVDRIKSSENDVKFQILRDTYLHALFQGVRPPIRFIEFSIILEMLLLPRQANELKYRFSLRLAKFMNKYYEHPVEEVFTDGKQIYDMRSSIVHTGKDKYGKLEITTKVAHEYIRKLLTKYLEDKSLFDDNKLESLCLN